MSPGEAAPATFSEESDDGRLLRRRAVLSEQGSRAAGVGPEPVATGPVATCGQGLPSDWPHHGSSEELLAPFLMCSTPSAFVALQRSVDMPRLVAALEDWDAVRLGALGPLLHSGAAEVLGRKRAAFLVTAAEKYGLPRAEIFALFILHSAFDDELRHLLGLLARDRQLGQTLGGMASVRDELRRRGVRLEDSPERAERAADVLRGLGRASRDALSSTPVSEGARYLDFAAKRGRLPPPYQDALDEVERALLQQHYAPGNMVLGGIDQLTFGVPLGFYHLVAGTGQGLASLSGGHYEQATRELAPAALLVALYAGGRGARHVSESLGAAQGSARRVAVPVPSLEGLKAVADRLGERLGSNALHELARYLQASREAGLLVAEGGEAAAAALYEARGNVTRAQAWLSEASASRPGPTSTRGGAGKDGGSLASRAREPAGFTREVLEAKLLHAELEAPGPRLPAEVALLERQAPRLGAPPPGVREGSALWGEYVTYWERRLGELREGKLAKGPLLWEGYQEMRGQFARGLEFERTMVVRLQADAALPQAQRRWLKDFHQPRIEVHVGVAKPGVAGVRYADVLVIEELPPAGQSMRVETFSFKSRNLTRLKGKALEAQMKADASEALNHYGGLLDIRRPGLKLHTQVQRVRLIYEGEGFRPRDTRALEDALEAAQSRGRGVEVSLE